MKCSIVIVLFTRFIIILINSCILSTHNNYYAGVYLSLRGTVYANNSIIPINEIGETNTMSMSSTGLQCITDKMLCCATRPNRFGDWFFPGGVTAVPGPLQSPTTFYRNRGDDGTVNLNRLSANVMTPTGQFCCMVRDAADTVQTVCVDIGM